MKTTMLFVAALCITLSTTTTALADGDPSTDSTCRALEKKCDEEVKRGGSLSGLECAGFIRNCCKEPDAYSSENWPKKRPDLCGEEVKPPTKAVTLPAPGKKAESKREEPKQAEAPKAKPAAPPAKPDHGPASQPEDPEGDSDPGQEPGQCDCREAAPCTQSCPSTNCCCCAEKRTKLQAPISPAACIWDPVLACNVGECAVSRDDPRFRRPDGSPRGTSDICSVLADTDRDGFDGPHDPECQGQDKYRYSQARTCLDNVDYDANGKPDIFNASCVEDCRKHFGANDPRCGTDDGTAPGGPEEDDKTPASEQFRRSAKSVAEWCQGDTLHRAICYGVVKGVLPGVEMRAAPQFALAPQFLQGMPEASLSLGLRHHLDFKYVELQPFLRVRGGPAGSSFSPLQRPLHWASLGGELGLDGYVRPLSWFDLGEYDLLLGGGAFIGTTHIGPFVEEIPVRGNLYWERIFVYAGLGPRLQYHVTDWLAVGGDVSLLGGLMAQMNRRNTPQGTVIQPVLTPALGFQGGLSVTLSLPEEKVLQKLYGH